MPLLAAHRSLIDRGIIARMQVLTRIKPGVVVALLLIAAADVIAIITCDGPTLALLLLFSALILAVLEGVSVAERTRARTRNAPVDPVGRRG